MTSENPSKNTYAQHGMERLASILGLWPGVAVCVVIALASQFVAEHYGAPAMLMALLFGMAFNFLPSEERTAYGIAFSARTLLRFSVALLGARIGVDLLISLGPAFVGLVIAAVIATILCGQLLARLFGRGWRLATITAGSVAICGASAALAVAAVLPKNKNSERNLTFTVMSVTILSTIAMILYPAVARMLEFDDLTAGVFLGGSIHDVAQVVGAGFSYSQEAGDTATLVKLIRVAMLAPVVLVLSILVRCFADENSETGTRPPLLPSFVVAFLLLATLNSFHLIPEQVTDAAEAVSGWGLLTAIAAVGMKTCIKDIRDIGRTAIYLVVLETLFIGGLILAGIYIIN